jgi:predicted GIY-YIG superfamily endonuclease
MSHYTDCLRKAGKPILYYVYTIVDSEGSVIDAGFTTDPVSRFKDHVNRKPGTGWGNGRHYGRADVHMRVEKVCETKKSARTYEDAVKERYGLPLTEKMLPRTGGKAISEMPIYRDICSLGGKSSASVTRTCPNCGKVMTGPSYFKHVKKCSRT